MLTPGPLAALLESGLLAPARPHRVAGMLAALLRHGLTPSTALAVSAAHSPDRVAVVDDTSSVTYAELDARCDAVAVLLAERGVGSSDVVALLGDGTRRYVEAMLAVGRLGADVVHLNTGFSATQVADTVASEGVSLVLHDPRLAGHGLSLDDEWDAEVDARLGQRPGRATRSGRQVILTSGTSGRPKGSVRDTSGALGPLLGLLQVIPLRAERTVLVAAPLFHAWGWAHACIGLLLRSTLVLTEDRRADRLLEVLERHDVDTLVTVPVVLARLVDAAGAGVPRLRVIAVSGSALPAAVATAAMDVFGDCVYNLYGATEVGWVTVAGPADLRADPSTAGHPVPGTVVRVVDDHDADVGRGAVGRIAVGAALELPGYTDGSEPARSAGLALTGDLGRRDADGRLQVVGRVDDMVVSGGENVYPSGVEDLLAAHPAIAEVAVVGVDDPAYGQRLRAVVVRARGASLDEEGVRDHVRAHRARHEVPREVVFVDELPRNAAGKVLRRELSR